MNRPRLLIVRGLPGSGKSTYVRNNYPGLFTLETDCFNCVGGQYYWTPNRSKEAIILIEDIVISVIHSPNTPDFSICGVFAEFKSFYDYINIAVVFGYDVYIKTLNTQYENIHNVPKEAIEIFKSKFITDKHIKCLLQEHFKENDLKHVYFDDMPHINWIFNKDDNPSKPMTEKEQFDVY